jgi:hypothetical protein
MLATLYLSATQLAAICRKIGIRRSPLVDSRPGSAGPPASKSAKAGVRRRQPLTQTKIAALVNRRQNNALAGHATSRPAPFFNRAIPAFCG